ncbi:hypothetical protein CYMTET_34672, partial [Cymbomonas tetramitiformis]
MPKAKKAAAKKAPVADFKKKKYKVGKRLAAPDNETKIDHTSKKIALPSQRVGEQEGGEPVSNRGLSMTELLGQTSHYSSRVRREALVALNEMLLQNPGLVPQHAAHLVDRLAERFSDLEKDCRDAFRALLKSSLLPGLPGPKLLPFLHPLMLHLCCAMTHLGEEVRLDSLVSFDLILQHAPAGTLARYSNE